MRTHKNKIYNCKVIDWENNIIHDDDYFTLIDVAKELGLSKDRIYNISCRKYNLHTYLNDFKYAPKVIIEKINLEK
tara:strand:+ start:999 stop:1226 length:228 start_codon:yes stop_codon:yes gene_type:complete